MRTGDNAQPDGPQAPGPQARVEAMRRALLRARARIRSLEARRQHAPLPPRAAARLSELHAEEVSLWRELRRVTQEEVPPEDGDG